MDNAVIDGITIEYEVAGTGEPVVLIHGALIADAFRPLLAEPSLAHGYRLITYHRRGYVGSSRTPGPISIARQAADCQALLRHLGIERAHIVGHSYGGAIALQLTLDTPGIVHSLALLEPALIVGATAQSYRDALALGQGRYSERTAAVVVDEFLEARFGAGYRTALDQIVPGGFTQAVADAGTWFKLEIAAFLDWSFGEAQARRITQPVLVVLGSESNALWPRFGETSRLLLAWLPDAKGFVLPGAAHGLQMQNPPGMAEALANFWTHHPIPSPT
ncbi:MAG: alpha/beta hydrolase [Chloroflexi bacterium]|nr:alpha/beta hydrolase [Chloroflexota bacterium]